MTCADREAKRSVAMDGARLGMLLSLLAVSSLANVVREVAKPGQCKDG